MSMQRCTLPLATSTYGFSKSAFALPPAVFHLPRNLNTHKYRCASSKRQLQTVTAYRPHTLESVPPPPRNAAIPESSIAGTVPVVNGTRSPQLTGEHDEQPPSGRPEKRYISVTEEEAQKTKPVTAGSTEKQSTGTPVEKPKRPKLRARKAAISLTPTAIERLRDLLSQPEPKMIRVGVKNRGCSGLAYHLEYVDKAGMFDETVEQDGVKVLIDSKALFSIIGSEMDWVEDKLNQRFTFRNPNISKLLILNFVPQDYNIRFRGTVWLWRIFHGVTSPQTTSGSAHALLHDDSQLTDSMPPQAAMSFKHVIWKTQNTFRTPPAQNRRNPRLSRPSSQISQNPDAPDPS